MNDARDAAFAAANAAGDFALRITAELHLQHGLFLRLERLKKALGVDGFGQRIFECLLGFRRLHMFKGQNTDGANHAGKLFFRAMDRRHTPDMGMESAQNVEVIPFRLLHGRRVAQTGPQRLSRFLHQIFRIVRHPISRSPPVSQHQKAQPCLVGKQEFLLFKWRQLHTMPPVSDRQIIICCRPC